MFKGIIASIFGAKGDSITDNTNTFNNIISTNFQPHFSMQSNSLLKAASQNITATQMRQQQVMSASLAQQQAASGIMLSGQGQNLYVHNNQHLYYGHTNQEIADYNNIGIDLLAHTINFKILNKELNNNTELLGEASEIFIDLFEQRNTIWFNTIKEAAQALTIMFDNNIPAQLIHKTLTIKTQTFTITGLQVQNETDLITLKMCL